MRNSSKEQHSSVANKIIPTKTCIIHLRNKQPVANMKLLLLLLLAGACQTYMPIVEQSWVKFRKVKHPAYKSSPLHGEPNMIHAKEILIEERMNRILTMIRNSLTGFQTHLKQYTTDLTKRIKRATAKGDYGFVRKPELRHQYGMLLNHHGQVISGLKNMDLFLSIDLPKLGCST